VARQQDPWSQAGRTTWFVRAYSVLTVLAVLAIVAAFLWGSIEQRTYAGAAGTLVVLVFSVVQYRIATRIQREREWERQRQGDPKAQGGSDRVDD
jgi:membrane protein YdbS with pleckstrin-like domain